jgi:hypothetical protein
MKRLSNSEIKARLILTVGISLAVAFLGSTAALLYGLLFVVQPLDVSPNDESAWALLSPDDVVPHWRTIRNPCQQRPQR